MSYGWRMLSGALMVNLLFAGAAFAGALEDGEAAAGNGDFATAMKLLRPLAEQGDGFGGLVHIGHDVIVEVLFQIVFDDDAVLFADVNQVGKQGAVFRPILLLAQKLDAFGEAFERLDHALGEFVLVAAGVELAVVGGDFFEQVVLLLFGGGNVGLTLGFGGF